MKKRSLNENESERLKKRPQTQTSHSQIAVNSMDLLSLSVRRLLSIAAKTTMVGATSTQIMEFVCLAHANLYDERIQLTSLASLGMPMTKT